MMHRRAVHHLIDFASGHLQRDLALQVQTHVSACQECRDWLETYRAVKMAVEREETNDADHVSAETLARFAIVPDYLTKETKDSVNSHVEQCTQCAEEADLCQRAVASSNGVAVDDVFPRERLEAFSFPKNDAGESGSESIAEAHLRQSSSWRGWKTTAVLRKPSVWMTLAASVVLGLAVSAALFWSPPQSLSSETYILTRRTLVGITTIEASEKIEASNSLVDPSATVTFRAKTVVLGDGFSVGNGASFTIESFSR